MLSKASSSAPPIALACDNPTSQNSEGDTAPFVADARSMHVDSSAGEIRTDDAARRS